MRFRDTNDLPELDPVAPPDVRDDLWFRMVVEIQDLRASEAHRWADDRLAAIQASIERTHAVTEAQLATIDRICGTEWMPSRQYDMTGRRRRWR